MAIRLCKVFRICRISDVQRKEDACFFFSQVQSFKYGSANLFRSECVDAESKGDDGFKTVNLHAAFVRQFDGMLCLIFPQNTAFTKSLYPCSDCWGDNPEQLAEFPLGHGKGRVYPCRHNALQDCGAAKTERRVCKVFFFMGYQMALQMLFSISPNLSDNSSKS